MEQNTNEHKLFADLLTTETLQNMYTIKVPLKPNLQQRGKNDNYG